MLPSFRHAELKRLKGGYLHSEANDLILEFDCLKIVSNFG